MAIRPFTDRPIALNPHIGPAEQTSRKILSPS